MGSRHIYLPKFVVFVLADQKCIFDNWFIFLYLEYDWLSAFFKIKHIIFGWWGWVAKYFGVYLLRVAGRFKCFAPSAAITLPVVGLSKTYVTSKPVVHTYQRINIVHIPSLTRCLQS